MPNRLSPGTKAKPQTRKIKANTRTRKWNPKPLKSKYKPEVEKPEVGFGRDGAHVDC
jgi:hypothetical protein